MSRNFRNIELFKFFICLLIIFYYLIKISSKIGEYPGLAIISNIQLENIIFGFSFYFNEGFGIIFSFFFCWIKITNHWICKSINENIIKFHLLILPRRRSIIFHIESIVYAFWKFVVIITNNFTIRTIVVKERLDRKSCALGFVSKFLSDQFNKTLTFFSRFLIIIIVANLCAIFFCRRRRLRTGWRR